MKGTVYRVRPTSINATTMAEHSGDCGSCTSKCSRGFFPLCMLHCRSRVHREEIRWQHQLSSSRRDTSSEGVREGKGTKREREMEDVERSFVRYSLDDRTILNLCSGFAERERERKSVEFLSAVYERNI